MSDFYTAKLQDVAMVLVSNVDKKTYSGQRNVVLCNYMDVYSNDYITADLAFMESTASDKEISQFTLRKGDIVITKDSESPFDIGVPAVVVDDIPNLVCGYHLAIIRPDLTQVDPYYLAKQLSDDACVKYFGKVAAGSTRFGLSNGAIKETPIMLTGLPTQKKIGHISRNVDAQIVETEALISKYQCVKQGIMTDLFSRGIDPATGHLRPSVQDAPELYHDTPLGPMPKAWDIVRAFDIAKEIVVGIVVEPSQYYLPEGVAVFRSANIQENRINEENFVFMSEESNQKNRKSMLRTGDVITVRTGYPGTTCVVPEKYDGANAVDIIITRLKEDVLPHFFSLWVNSDWGKGQVLSAQGGLAQQHFNVGAMKDLLLPKTSMEEQAAILEAASSLLQTITLESNYLGKLKRQKAGLMRDLLTGKVPVIA